MIHLRASSDEWGYGVRVSCYDTEENYAYSSDVHGNIEKVDCNVGDFIPNIFRLNKEQSKSLMDDLWRAGVRPSSGEGSVGQIGATEKHLEDMRTIAFKKLGIEK